MLMIESPEEGEKATLAPAGINDDPWSLGVIRELQGRGRSDSVTIHRQRGGRYWYYWVLIIGGLAFAVAFYATDGFGLSP